MDSGGVSVYFPVVEDLFIYLSGIKAELHETFYDNCSDTPRVLVKLVYSVIYQPSDRDSCLQCHLGPSEVLVSESGRFLT